MIYAHAPTNHSSAFDVCVDASLHCSFTLNVCVIYETSYVICLDLPQGDFCCWHLICISNFNLYCLHTRVIVNFPNVKFVLHMSFTLGAASWVQYYALYTSCMFVRLLHYCSVILKWSMNQIFSTRKWFLFLPLFRGWLWFLSIFFDNLSLFCPFPLL